MLGGEAEGGNNKVVPFTGRNYGTFPRENKLVYSLIRMSFWSGWFSIATCRGNHRQWVRGLWNGCLTRADAWVYNQHGGAE